MNRILTIFFLITILFSCHKKIDNKNDIENLQNWNSFIIETGFQKVEIFKYTDSISFTNTIYKDGVFDIPPKYELDKKKEGIIVLNKTERDSLISHIVNIISKPTFTDIHATDYVGNVKFILKRHNMETSCQYNSVGDWTKLSNDTKRVYEILNKKIKLSTQ